MEDFWTESFVCLSWIIAEFLNKKNVVYAVIKPLFLVRNIVSVILNTRLLLLKWKKKKKKVALDMVVLLSVFVKSQKQLVWVQLGVQLWCLSLNLFKHGVCDNRARFSESFLEGNFFGSQTRRKGQMGIQNKQKAKMQLQTFSYYVVNFSWGTGRNSSRGEASSAFADLQSECGWTKGQYSHLSCFHCLLSCFEDLFRKLSGLSCVKTLCLFPD